MASMWWLLLAVVLCLWWLVGRARTLYALWYHLALLLVGFVGNRNHLGNGLFLRVTCCTLGLIRIRNNYTATYMGHTKLWWLLVVVLWLGNNPGNFLEVVWLVPLML